MEKRPISYKKAHVQIAQRGYFIVYKFVSDNCIIDFGYC
mgnify:CR=1 FL=1